MCDVCVLKIVEAIEQVTKYYLRTSMGKKLFVGGLPYSTTEESLKNAFAQAGTVESAKIITDRMSGRSKGFGFVEMATEEEAAAAVELWNGKEFEGRTISVSEARPMGERPPRRNFGGGGRGGFRGGNRGGDAPAGDEGGNSW